jgi:hypothetical protein
MTHPRKPTPVAIFSLMILPLRQGIAGHAQRKDILRPPVSKYPKEAGTCNKSTTAKQVRPCLKPIPIALPIDARGDANTAKQDQWELPPLPHLGMHPNDLGLFDLADARSR